MPGNDSAVEQSRDGHKFPGTHRWRAKLFSNDRITRKENHKRLDLDTAVSDFLGNATSKASAERQLEPSTPLTDTTTAREWPPAAGAAWLDTEATLHTGEPSQQSSRAKSPSDSRRKKNKGLRVRFADAAPLIIGEGGDEADLPPREIATLRGELKQERADHQADANKRALLVGDHRHDQPLERSRHVAPGSNEDPKSAPWQRRSTAIVTSTQNLRADVPQDYGRAAPNEQFSSVMNSSEDDEALTSHSPPAEVVATATKPKMRLEEGQALHVGFPPSSRSSQTTTIQRAEINARHRPSFSTRGYTLSDVDTMADHSLRPTPLPQPPSDTRALPSPSCVPSSVTPGASSHPPSSSSLGSSPDAMQTDDPPLDRVPKATPLSIRAVAHTVGSDALDDFAGCVQHYNSLFRVTAAAGQPTTSISFAKWIRAATWWFLKGRRELESTIRNRPRSADSSKGDHDSSSHPDISQAFVDLAKTWFILKEVTPEHPEPRRYGNAGMKAMAAIIRSFGEEKLAEAVEMHVALVASMRALTISMRRNNLIPPIQQIDSELTGLDMRIWNAPPQLAPYVLILLSSNLSQPFIENETSHDSDQYFSIPIGDTAGRFCYSSMFVDIIITVQGESGEGIRLPCVLSILRERTHWQMEAIVASQDEQVHLVIQSDKSAGPTWSDVKWKARTWQLQIRLTDRIELLVQFKEHDYKSLCGLYDHAQHILRSLEPGGDETLVFETTLKNFLCHDPRHSKRFPSDAIKRCGLRLFEKTITRFEGPGPRRVQQGYRLTIVTPPKVKNSSSVQTDLGCKKPVLFSYLCAEDGAPALLLKLFYEAEFSAENAFSVVMTFHEAAEREEMHSLLNGTATRSSESTVASPLLRSVEFRTRSLAGNSPSGSELLPAGIQWEQMRIINDNLVEPQHGRDRTVLSQSLRLCLASPMGTMTDRINLGWYTRGFSPASVCY